MQRHGQFQGAPIFAVWFLDTCDKMDAFISQLIRYS